MLTYKLCCRGSGCPSITLEGDIFTITDDSGGKVTLTTDEAFALASIIDHHKTEGELAKLFSLSDESPAK